MKEKELIRQMKRIQLHLEKKQIIPRAMEIAEKYGAHKSKTHSYHVSFEDKFLGKDYLNKEICIEHDGGWSMFGGEGLRIDYNSNSVFYANTSEMSGFVEKNQKSLIKIGELYVHDYSPGAWEKQLALICKKGPKSVRKKKEVVIEKDVEQSRLEELASRLPIKI